jgi:hypothetical protein
VKANHESFSSTSGNEKSSAPAPLSQHTPQKNPPKSKPRILHPNAACFAEHSSQLAARDTPPSRVKSFGAKRCVKQKQVNDARSNREELRLSGDNHLVVQHSIYMPKLSPGETRSTRLRSKRGEQPSCAPVLNRGF